MLDELENEKLIEENIKLKRLLNIQNKLIKSYDLRKHEYQKSIIDKSIKMKTLLQKKNKEESEEEEEI